MLRTFALTYSTFNIYMLCSLCRSCESKPSAYLQDRGGAVKASCQFSDIQPSQGFIARLKLLLLSEERSCWLQ